MIVSEILQEKNKVQAKLCRDSTSIHDYLVRSHLAAKEIAASHGFRLRYAKLPNKRFEWSAGNIDSQTS